MLLGQSQKRKTVSNSLWFTFFVYLLIIIWQQIWFTYLWSWLQFASSICDHDFNREHRRRPPSPQRRRRQIVTRLRSYPYASFLSSFPFSLRLSEFRRICSGGEAISRRRWAPTRQASVDLNSGDSFLPNSTSVLAIWLSLRRISNLGFEILI